MHANIDKTLDIRDADGKLCGTYHYQDPFKSFFRGLYTPGGNQVVAPPPAPPEHQHHKGLQFGLCLSDVNFWEESEDAEPCYCKLPIGTQRTDTIDLLPPRDGIGFSQQVVWEHGEVVSFRETRRISVYKVPGAFVWTWRTTLTAARDVEIITSAWRGPGYCGLGLRLIQKLFQNGKVLPPGMESGSIPAFVSYQGNGVEVKFGQDASQADALFVSYYGGNPDFAFMALGPTNLQPRSLNKNQSLEGTYVVTVADR
jgi:hypothetical protein